MLHLASMEGVLTDFYPVGIYHDVLFELKDYTKLCCKLDYDNAIHICNKSPWSDWIWSNPNPDLGLFKEDVTDSQKDIYELKGHIYSLGGWKPDAIVNIYDNKPTEKWRNRLKALCLIDPDITIINLNASDQNFSNNIVETLQILDTRKIEGW